MNNNLLQRLLQQYPDFEIFVRIGDDVFPLEFLKVGQVLDDCGRLSPYLGEGAFQPGEKRFCLFLYAGP